MIKKHTSKNMQKKTLFILFFVFWAIFGAFNFAYSTTTYAQEGYDYKKSAMRKGNNIMAAGIYEGLAAGSSDLSGFTDATSIGFDTLYGTTQRDTTYTGEVPGSDTAYADYPHMLNEWMGNIYRAWWKEPTTVQSSLSWSSDGTNDLHAYLLVSHSNTSILTPLLKGFGSFSFTLASILNAPFAFILRLLISMANFDINTISSALNLGELSNMISNMFTINTQDGWTMSPLLIIALAVFMVGLVSLVVKYMFGKSAEHKLLQEIGYLVLALVLMTVSAVSGGYATLIQQAGALTQSVVSGIGSSQGGDAGLFAYDTGSPNADLNYNIAGLSAKGYIDTVIYSQFGYPTDELYLWKDGGDDTTQKNWGISTQTMKNLVSNLTKQDGKAGDENLFSVSLGGNANNKSSPNIGYWWYAVTSGVNPSDPFYKDDDGKIVTNKCDVKQGVFVMDLMAAIHAECSEGSEAYKKTQKIMDVFYEHDWKWAEMFMNIIITILLTLAIFWFALFSFIFKIFFNIGFIIIPIIPILLLIEKTRPTAKKLLFSWLLSTIIFTLCLVCMCTVLYTSSALSSQGFGGILVDIGLLVAAMLVAPKLVQTILVMPNKMGMEGIGAVENVLSVGNKQLGNIRKRGKGNVNRNASKRIEELSEKDVHKNKSDMSSFNKASGEDNNFKKGLTSSQMAEGALRSRAENDELIRNLKDADWNKLANKTASDIAKLGELSDSEVLRKSGCTEDFIDAIEHKEKRQEQLEERKAKLKAKRINFYEGIQSNRAVSLISHTRLGNYMVNSVMQFENWRAGVIERSGYRSHFKPRDIIEKYKEKKEMRQDQKVKKRAIKEGKLNNNTVDQHRAKLRTDILEKRIQEGNKLGKQRLDEIKEKKR